MSTTTTPQVPRKRGKRGGGRPRPEKQRFKVGEVEAALRAAGGIYTDAALRLKCAPNTIANYIKRSPRLQRVEAEVTGILLDVAESKLLTEVRAGNLTAIIFYLKCKGKRRGYVERAELTAPEGPIAAGNAVHVYLPAERAE